jgi:hemolysin III
LSKFAFPAEAIRKDFESEMRSLRRAQEPPVPTSRDFPSYSNRESRADQAIHVAGLTAALLGVAWLVIHTRQSALPKQLATWIYGAGLMGMFGLSAAYNFTRPGLGKSVLRRLDHAMIFIMIAGSYTPFALCVLDPNLGIPLLVAAWVVAVLGAGLKLWLGARYAVVFMILYLMHGWMILAVLPSLVAVLQPGVVTLLVGGGIVYSLGTLVHTRRDWPFHNAAWHAMVLLAACLHLRAISDVLLRPNP